LKSSNKTIKSKKVSIKKVNKNFDPFEDDGEIINEKKIVKAE